MYSPRYTTLYLLPTLRSSVAWLLFFLAGAAAAQTPRPGAEDASALRAVITAWASAWQSQFVDEYLAHYTPDYKADGFASHDEWRTERRLRIAGPEYIRVTLDEFELVAVSASAATVRFRLHYSRPGYADRTLKELQLRNSGQAWQISAERNREVVRLPAS